MRFLLPFALLAASCAADPAPRKSEPLPVPPPPPKALLSPPEAALEPVVEELFGARLVDNYRWLDTDAARRESYMRAAGAYTRQVLDALPDHARWQARAAALSGDETRYRKVQRAGEGLVYLRQEPGHLVDRLYVREADGKERLLADPEGLAPAGSHASIDGVAPSADGSRIAYNLSSGGGEVSSIRIVDVVKGPLPDIVPRVWGEFSASWLPDGKGFFYSQMREGAPVDPLLGMRVQSLHRLGTALDEDEAYVGSGIKSKLVALPQEMPLIYNPLGSPLALAAHGGARLQSRVAVARLSELQGPATPWKEIARYDDVVEGVTVLGEDIYLLSKKNAPLGRVLRWRGPGRAPEVVLGETPGHIIANIHAAKDALYIVDLVEGVNVIRRLQWKQKTPTTVELPYAAHVVLSTDGRRSGALVKLESWTTPGSHFELDTKGRFIDLKLADRSAGDFAGIVVERLVVKASDGESVPLTVLRRRDLAVPGIHPTILSGYGGYGISSMPRFNATLLAWLERGGVYAIAHVRGGGEKGDAWRRAGSGVHKMVGIGDFLACAEHLIASGYTDTRHLGASGTSMGGVLVGRALTERPELFGAVEINVGVTNPLRILHEPNGANQIAELGGSPDTAEGFAVVRAQDTYSHVVDGKAYPAVLITVGLHDGRVPPSWSAKLAARLKAASSSGRPILLRVEQDAGHGIGSTTLQRASKDADSFAFFAAQLRVNGALSLR